MAMLITLKNVNRHQIGNQLELSVDRRWPGREKKADEMQQLQAIWSSPPNEGARLRVQIVRPRLHYRLKKHNPSFHA